MLLKGLTAAFALYALLRVVSRYRRGGGLTVELVVWLLIFSGLGAVVFIPSRTDALARLLGVSSGFNALTFITITGLLFAVYRLFQRVQTLQRDLTRLVRELALQDPEAVAPKRDAG